MTSRPVINCVSLRELQLDKLHISEEVLDDIFSACSLLVKVKLSLLKGDLKTIKIKNLGCLKDLTISSLEGTRSSATVLESDHVPNLNYFMCDLRFMPSQVGNPLPFNAHSLSLGSGVTELWLRGLIIDDACMDLIESKLPFLKVLTLDIRNWRLRRFDITCASMERLTLQWCPSWLTKVQVNAPKLTFFCFEGRTIPSFVFPTRLKQIKLVLSLSNPVQARFFVKMRKALKLSINCYIEIRTMNNTVVHPPFDEDIVLNLRERIPFPAKNVPRLSFETIGDEGKWEPHSLFFDALFSICRPKNVVAKPDARFKHNNHFFKLMVNEVMEKNTRKVSDYLHWPYYLKDFKMIPENDDVTVFKLNWR
ncbi:hypothetical protein L1887_25729 [Cichorium endivia]|nr:hypothetical protein L1887_25729 [Cichorium endivia]